MIMTVAEGKYKLSVHEQNHNVDRLVKTVSFLDPFPIRLASPFGGI